MKRIVFLLPILGICFISCEKSLEEEAPQNFDLVMRGVVNDQEGGTFTPSPGCEGTGALEDCCPPPATDCMTPGVELPPAAVEIIRNVADIDASAVKDFFENEEWEIYFPQIIGEPTVLRDINAEVYMWVKHEYGDFIWVEFIPSDDQEHFYLPIKEV